MSKNSDKGKNRMKPRMVRVSDTSWLKAKEKAGLIPMSKVIRRLIEKWIAGEINLD